MGSNEEMGLDQLPSALVATIMSKLDIASICSLASTSSTFRSCARHILSFLPTFHLLVPISLSPFLNQPTLPFRKFLNLIIYVAGHCAFGGVAETLATAQSLPHQSQARLRWPRRFRNWVLAQTLLARPFSPQLRRFQWQTLVRDRQPMQPSQVEEKKSLLPKINICW